VWAAIGGRDIERLRRNGYTRKAACDELAINPNTRRELAVTQATRQG
jgi:hypothetical protein